MTVAVPDIKGFCFDFDGVFYGYDLIQDFYSLCDRMIARSAVQILENKITLSEAEKLGRESYQKHGNAITEFCVWAEQEGHDPVKLRDTLFKIYHINLREYLLQNHPNYFVNRSDLQRAFKLSHGHVCNGVATHSCAENWAKPFLTDMGIDSYFHMHAVHGLDEVDYTLKHLDPCLVELTFRSLGINPNLGCFVEDTARNLKAMKDRSPETRCVLIHHGQPLERLPSYIDDQFDNILEMKKAYYEIGKNERKIILAPQ